MCIILYIIPYILYYTISFLTFIYTDFSYNARNENKE